MRQRMKENFVVGIIGWNLIVYGVAFDVFMMQR
jgi:hypothetical protein